MINLFSLLAWCNIGHIDWQPWLSRVRVYVERSTALMRSSYLDFYTYSEKSLAARRQNSSVSSTVPLFNVKHHNVDCGHDGQRELVSAVSQRSVHGHQELLPSVELGKVPAGLGHLPFETVAGLRRPCSPVSQSGTHSRVTSDHFRERKENPIWYFEPPASYRLTEQDITDFVDCVKECAFIAIFTKAHLKEAAKACQYLSMLRPESIVPPIVEK